MANYNISGVQEYTIPDNAAGSSYIDVKPSTATEGWIINGLIVVDVTGATFTIAKYFRKESAAIQYEFSALTDLVSDSKVSIDSNNFLRISFTWTVSKIGRKIRVFYFGVKVA